MHQQFVSQQSFIKPVICNAKAQFALKAKWSMVVKFPVGLQKIT